jgi:hypothetical protein
MLIIPLSQATGIEPTINRHNIYFSNTASGVSPRDRAGQPKQNSTSFIKFYSKAINFKKLLLAPTFNTLFNLIPQNAKQ